MNKLRTAAIALAATLSLAAAAPAGATTHPKTKNHTTTRIVYRNSTPPACVAAIHEFGQISTIFSKVLSGPMEGYIGLIKSAAQAGSDESTTELQVVVDSEDNFTSQVNAFQAQLSPLETQAEADVTACER